MPKQTEELSTSAGLELVLSKIKELKDHLLSSANLNEETRGFVSDNLDDVLEYIQFELEDCEEDEDFEEFMDIIGVWDSFDDEDEDE